jgi:hypothetical protein
MVIFQSTDGSPGYQQCEGIDDAVKFVEELRNDRGVDRARIFRMEEVEFEFRPYWFVVQRDAAAAVTAPVMPPPAPSSMVAEPEALTVTDRTASEGPETGGDEAVAEREPEAPAAAPAAPVDPFAPPPPPPSRGLFGR